MRRKNPGEASDVTHVNCGEPDVTHACPARSVFAQQLTAGDGTTLHGVLHTGPGTPSDLGFVVGHGFTHHVRRRTVRRVLERLATHAPVLGVDFRGHGRSGGGCTVGAAETLDLAAALERLRRLGCRRVVAVGFSMGASVALRQAALASPNGRPDAVVAVSSPPRWWVRDTEPMRRVHWLLEQPHGRLGARLLGVRLGPEWSRVPSSPIELVDRIPPTPVLLVHGENDDYFRAGEAVALHEACGGSELWLEPGMGHAEGATTPALVDRIATWALDTVRVPDRVSH